MNYREALEFIGEVRAGISWERFCIRAVGLSDPLIEILNDSEKARQFLSLRGIRGEYVSGHIRSILRRLHFNRDNDLYLTLALPHTASESQIHKRWKELMLIYHPDRNPGKEAAECAAKINEAYNVLKNPEKRTEYDAERRSLLERAKAREIRKYSSAAMDRPTILSPRVRRTLPKLIIPFCILISFFVLLAMFLENRTKNYVYHDSTREVEKAKEESRAEGETPMTTVQKKESPEIQKKEAPPESIRRDADSARRTLSPTDAPDASRKTFSETAKIGEAHEQTKRARSEALQAPAAAVVAEEEGSPGEPVKELTQKKTAQIQGETAGDKTAKAAQPVPDTETENVEKAVNHFISRYVRAYEEGDIGKFISLYSQSAVENNRMKYEEIKKAYRKNFEQNRYRYSLRNVQFRKSGDTVVLTAMYIIHKSTENSPEAVIQGEIRWVLAKEGEMLKIVKADYDGR